MQKFYKDRIDEFSGLFAYHYEAAGLLLDAANYAARAAVWVGSTNSAQAIKHWQRVRTLLQKQPRSQAHDTLRIMSSSQIAWLGWQEGMTADEAKPFIEEALAWSRETDNSMIPLLLFVDGRILVASGGPADAYVQRVQEALSLLKEGKDVGRIATLNAALSQAYGWAGLLNEALAANTAALEGISRIEKFDYQFLGFSVEHWALSLRGRILVRLGRFADAEKCFNLVLGIEHTLVDPNVLLVPHLGYVDLAWCRGDAALAEQHASRVAEIAEKHGSPYLRVYAFACRGAAKSTAKDFAARCSRSPTVWSSCEGQEPRWSMSLKCLPVSLIVIIKAANMSAPWQPRKRELRWRGGEARDCRSVAPALPVGQRSLLNMARREQARLKPCLDAPKS